MLITDIIEYFRQLANRHKDIACFKTGESYEMNHNGLSYPLLFLNTDFTTSFSDTDDLLDEEYIYVTLRLSVLVLSRESEQNSIDNQIKAIDNPRLQDEDLALTHRIMTQLVLKCIKDFNEDFVNGWMLMGDNGGIAIKRVINDDCDGWNIDLTLKMHNSLCDFEDAFGDDVIDKGENKTEYQAPINVNPIQTTEPIIEH